MGVSEIPHSFISIHSISVENRVCARFPRFPSVNVWACGQSLATAILNGLQVGASDKQIYIQHL